jgi:hypothetical protein
MIRVTQWTSLSPSGVLGLIRVYAVSEIFGMVGKIETPVTLDSTAVRKLPQ